MNKIQVFASPVPFSNKQTAHTLPHGLSIAEIVARVLPPPYSTEGVGIVVMIGGNVIDFSRWDIIPEPGLLNIRVVPMKGGGGGKNPIASLLSIAVLVAAPYVGGALAGGLGITSKLGIQIVTAAVGAIGRLAVSALAPPPKPSNVNYAGQSFGGNPAESPTQFIEGASNVIDPFGVIPVNLGTNRMFPKQAARPYTEIIGSDQFSRQLFTYGYAPTISLTDKKLGESAITQFTDYDLFDITGANLHESTSLYANDVFQDDFSTLLSFSAGYITRTTQLNCNEAIIDITFPQGLTQYADNGARKSTTVSYTIEYRETGSGGGWTSFETGTITAAQKEAVRKAFRIVFATADQYDIRIKRNTEDATSDQVFNEFYWTALKSVTYQSPVNLVGLNGTALRIKATDQLNGTVNQFNAIVSTHIPDYDADTDSWVLRATSNPASIYRYILQGLPNAKALPDSKIDIPALEDWHTHCVAEGYTYNRVIDYETSVDALLRDVASAGAASPSIVDGKRTVVIDRIKDDIVQVITPRNSWSYSAELVYPTLPHAFRVQFRNAQKGYQLDERIVYDDGYTASNATVFEVLELQSCTNADLAFKTARRHLAAIRLRPETHTWMMDVEHLVALRGDRVTLVHDIPLVGIGDGRIKTVTDDGGSPALCTGFTLDDTVAVPDDETYYVRIRKSDGTMLYKELVTEPGYATEFTFAIPFSLDDAPDAGDLCAFFEVGGELDLIITRIEPQDDLTAKITAIDYAQPAINTAENAAIPVFDSKVTTPLELIRPLAPILVSEQSNESVMLLNSDGSYLSRWVITLNNPNDNDVYTLVKVREAGTSVFTDANILEANPGRVVLTGLEDGVRYDVHIRYKRANGGMFSLPLELNNTEFIGASADPDDVTGFKIAVTDNMAIFSWTKSPNIDVKKYALKYSPLYSGVTWDTAVYLSAEIYETRYSTPFRGGTYLIKAIDILGNESADATAIITYNPGQVANAVATLIEEPDWLGTHDNTVEVGGALELIDTTQTGIYELSDIINLDAKYPCFVSAEIEAGGAFKSGASENDMFTMPDIFSEDDLYGIGLGVWSLDIQYSIIQDDPADSPALWSDWETLQAGVQEFYAIKFRVVMNSNSPLVTPQISVLHITVDMPDRIERWEDIEVPDTGVSISFTPEFRDTPAVAITIQDGAADDKIEYTAKSASGITFKVYNETAADYVTRSADVIASGFGRKNAP